VRIHLISIEMGNRRAHLILEYIARGDKVIKVLEHKLERLVELLGAVFLRAFRRALA